MGATASEKSGRPTVTKAGWLPFTPELVPVTTTTCVPEGVLLVVVIVNVEVWDPLIEDGLKLAVTPVGEPRIEADKVTLPAKLFPGVSEIVVVPCEPGERFNVLGDADKAK